MCCCVCLLLCRPAPASACRCCTLHLHVLQLALSPCSDPRLTLLHLTNHSGAAQPGQAQQAKRGPEHAGGAALPGLGARFEAGGAYMHPRCSHVLLTVCNPLLLTFISKTAQVAAECLAWDLRKVSKKAKGQGEDPTDPANTHSVLIDGVRITYITYIWIPPSAPKCVSSLSNPSC